tara:strand:- start:300 stop:725 length:426 start_codon:yes stop_codon:yes gene_type:complete
MGRRLGALLYDIFVLLGLLFIAALPLPWFDQIAGETLLALWVKRIYLLSVCFIYFGGFWVNDGQTLGMKAWRIRVIQLSGHTIGWGHALKRFTGLCISSVTLGLGFFWMPADSKYSNWDRLCCTRVIWHPKASPKTTTSKD